MVRRFVALALAASATCVATIGVAMAQNSLYDLSATTIDGKNQSLAEYKGKVALVVNVASQCGFTRQYEGLQELYNKYKERGLVVLGFPSNDFGGQEPGSDEEIKNFCSRRFGVTFPMFSKVDVLGPSKSAVYAFLTKSTGGADVGWNFEKFLVGRNGLVVGRYGSSVTPGSSELADAIEKALAQ